MRNKEIAKGLRLIAEGFTTLAVAYESKENAPEVMGLDITKAVDTTVLSTVNTESGEVVSQEVIEPVKEEPKTEPVVEEITPVEKIVPEVKEEPTTTLNIPSEEELNALSYNELKSKAKELGVKAVGSKKVIIANILALASQGEEKTEEPHEVSEPMDDLDLEKDEVVTEEDTEGEIEIEIGEDLEDEDEEELPEETNNIYDKIANDLKGYTDEELADILSSVGVSPKGRRQALLSKIVQAIEDGKLEWEDEESLDIEPEDDTEEVEAEQVKETDEGNNFNGTETRKHACYEESERIESEYNKDNLSDKEILKFLKDYHNGRYVSLGQEEDLEEYMAIHCGLIDDEGKKHELADPYYIGDDVYCCGHKLKEVNDDYYCEICGTTYTV